MEVIKPDYLKALHLRHINNTFNIKLLHFNLNLNYKQKNITIENQTNQLINFICNDFVNKFQNDLKNKYVILEFQNDTISLLGYKILKVIQVIVPFQLLIYGKDKVLKQDMKTKDKKKRVKEKRIYTHTLKKLIKNDKAIFVSCYNPIYQVTEQEKTFKEMDCYYLLKDFIPEELKIAFQFYGIEEKEPSDSRAEVFQSFCDGIENSGFDLFLLNEIKAYKKEIREINIVKLTGDNEKDNELLVNVADKDEPIFYHCEENKDYPILFSEYQYYLKNKSNIYGYWNENTHDIAKQFQKQFKCKVNFYGDFADKEKELWLYV